MINEVIPGKTREDRLRQYVKALIGHDYETYTQRDLGLRGPVWSTCSIALRDAGVIRIEEKRKYCYRYRIMVSKEELQNWIEKRE